MEKMSLETSKEMLLRELQNAPYVKDGILGNAGSRRKVCFYVCACVRENLPQAEAIEWFEKNIAKELSNQKEVERIKAWIEGAYICKAGL